MKVLLVSDAGSIHTRRWASSLKDAEVLLVSDAGSIHTRRWASSLKDAGVDVVLFSITREFDTLQS